jgi:hypothetical protein
MKYPDAFKQAVLQRYPEARLTHMGPITVSFSIPNGVDESGNKRERVIARYYVKTGKGEIYERT